MDVFLQKKNVLCQIDGYGRTLDQEHYMAFYSDFKGKSISQVQRLLQEKYIPDETKRIVNFYFQAVMLLSCNYTFQDIYKLRYDKIVVDIRNLFN